MARAVQAPLPVDVLLAIGAAPVADDMPDVLQLRAASQRIGIFPKLADDLLGAVLDVDQPRRIAGPAGRNASV